jgi:unsaturated chondroitin disaccharide hydrolase
VMASALIELSGFVKGKEKSTYLSSAEKMLSVLSSPEYFAAPGTNGGFLIKHSVGALPFNAEVDFAITYADYYYVEAALRYLAL